jgi:hypothetical protein
VRAPEWAARGLRGGLICPRGVPPPGSRDLRDCENNFFAFVVPFVWIADPEKQERGLHAVISCVQRIQPGADDPTVKKAHARRIVEGIVVCKLVRAREKLKIEAVQD